MTSGKRDAEIRAIVKPLWHYIDVKNPNKKLEIKPTMKKNHPANGYPFVFHVTMCLWTQSHSHGQECLQALVGQALLL